MRVRNSPVKSDEYNLLDELVYAVRIRRNRLVERKGKNPAGPQNVRGTKATFET